MIPAEAIDVPTATGRPHAAGIEYHSDNPNDDVIRNWLVADGQRRGPIAAVPLPPASTRPLADRLNQPVGIDNLGLVDRDRLTTAGDGPRSRRPRRSTRSGRRSCRPS